MLEMAKNEMKMKESVRTSSYQYERKVRQEQIDNAKIEMYQSKKREVQEVKDLMTALKHRSSVAQG